MPALFRSCNAHLTHRRISTCACPTVLDPVCVKAVRVVKVPFLGAIRVPYSFTVSSQCLAKCQVLNGTFTKGACPGDNLLYDATAYTCGCTFGIQPGEQSVAPTHPHPACVCDSSGAGVVGPARGGLCSAERRRQLRPLATTCLSFAIPLGPHAQCARKSLSSGRT